MLRGHKRYALRQSKKYAQQRVQTQGNTSEYTKREKCAHSDRRAESRRLERPHTRRRLNVRRVNLEEHSRGLMRSSEIVSTKHVRTCDGPLALAM